MLITSRWKEHYPSVLLSRDQVKCKNHSVVSNSLGLHELYTPWNSPGQNTGTGSRSLLQGIFPTQGSNPGLLHCSRILYCLSYQGSSRILEWVVCPFSCGSSQPRSQTKVSCTAGGFFTSWATREVIKSTFKKMWFCFFFYLRTKHLFLNVVTTH